MAYVKGTSTGARQLAAVLKVGKGRIDQRLQSIAKEGNAVKQAWRDDGNIEVDEIVSDFKNKMRMIDSDLWAVCVALEKYAQVLEQMDKKG